MFYFILIEMEKYKVSKITILSKQKKPLSKRIY